MATATIRPPCYRVRHPYLGEPYPDGIWPDKVHVNPSWLWLLCDDVGTVKMALLAAPVHGLVFIVRLWSAEDAPKFLLRRLLRSFASECLDRGFKAGMTFLSVDQPKEVKLAKLALRYGATGIGFTGFCYGGGLDKLWKH